MTEDEVRQRALQRPRKWVTKAFLAELYGAQVEDHIGMATRRYFRLRECMERANRVDFMSDRAIGLSRAWQRTADVAFPDD